MLAWVQHTCTHVDHVARRSWHHEQSCAADTYGPYHVPGSLLHRGGSQTTLNIYGALAPVTAGQPQQQQQHACSTGNSDDNSNGSSSGITGWRGRLHGWLGGDAGLPVDGWLTTCCSQVRSSALAISCKSTAEMVDGVNHAYLNTAAVCCVPCATLPVSRDARRLRSAALTLLTLQC